MVRRAVVLAGCRAAYSLAPRSHVFSFFFFCFFFDVFFRLWRGVARRPCVLLLVQAPRAHMSAYVSIRQHTAAYGSIRRHTCDTWFRRQLWGTSGSTWWNSIRPTASLTASHSPNLSRQPTQRIRHHTSPYVSIRQHVSIRYAYATHTSDLLAFAEGELTDAQLDRAFIPQ